MTVLEKEDWRSVISLVTNAKQVVTLVQDVASKVAGYAKFRSATGSSGTKKLSLVSKVLPVRPGGNSAPWHQL